MGSTIQLVGNSLTDLKNDSKKEEKINTNYLNIKEKLIQIKQTITIEPLLCLYLIAIVLCDPALNNLQLEMACKGNAGFNETVCNAVVAATHAEHNFTEQNSKVQQYISDMLSWAGPIQSVVPVAILLFVGSYSDRHGIRKPFLLMPFFGEFLATISSIICVLFKDVWPVEMAGITQFVVSSFFGGPSLITMAAFAYVADITLPEQRTARIAIIQVCLSICIPIATLVSGILFDSIGYIPSLMIGVMLFVVGFIYGLFFVKEPKQMRTANIKDLIKDVVNPQHVIETIRLFTKSKGIQRQNILLVLILIYISATVVGGEDYVFFYFVQHAYGWNFTDYTYFIAAYSIITSLGLAAGAFILSKVLHLDDLIIIALSYLDKIASNIIYITVRNSFGIYLGVLVGVLQDAAGTVIRSLSTKYVSEEDTGKAQSLTTIVEAIGYAISAQIYHQGIYTYTRDKYIQAFFYVGIGLYSVGIIIIIWKYLRQRSDSSLGTNENETEMKKRNSISK